MWMHRKSNIKGPIFYDPKYFVKLICNVIQISPLIYTQMCSNVTRDPYYRFHPSDRYLWMKVAGEISQSRDLSAMFSPAPLPWFVYSNLLQNVSRSFINPTDLTWHGYFMHVVRADIRTSHVSYALSSMCLACTCHGWNSTQTTCTENITFYKLTN